jgi:hypothetical protein
MGDPLQQFCMRQMTADDIPAVFVSQGKTVVCLQGSRSDDNIRCQ